jgi:hypothetical protein
MVNVQYDGYNPIGIPRFFGAVLNRQNGMDEMPCYMLIFNKLRDEKNIGFAKMSMKKRV